MERREDIDRGEQARQPSPVEAAAVYLVENRQRLGEATAAVDMEGDPSDVFPAPPEVRASAPDPGYTAEQEAALRVVVSRFGMGAENDVRSATDYKIFEGGLPWKIEAEAVNAIGIRIFAGSSQREIGDNERAYLRNKTDDPEAHTRIDGLVTELDMARELAALTTPGFTPLEEDITLPFGYEVAEGFAFTEEATDQLVQIGTDATQSPVYLLKVDREDYIDEDGKPRYRQPDGAALSLFMSGVLDRQLDPMSSIGFVTSQLYTSRIAGSVLAGLQAGRRFAVDLYGRQTLADVKGTAMTPPTPINQIPGELHIMDQKLKELEQAVLATLGAEPRREVVGVHPQGGVITHDQLMDVGYVTRANGSEWIYQWKGKFFSDPDSF
jgi:hypothetical protein